MPTDGRHILFICSTCDCSIHVTGSAKLMQRAMVKHDRGDQCSVLEMNSAGHLLEPPYIPVTQMVFS